MKDFLIFLIGLAISIGCLAIGSFIGADHTYKKMMPQEVKIDFNTDTDEVIYVMPPQGQSEAWSVETDASKWTVSYGTFEECVRVAAILEKEATEFHSGEEAWGYYKTILKLTEKND